MQRSLRRAGLAAAAGAALAVGLAPAATAAPAPGSLAAELTDAVTLDGVYRHLEALQAIGDANGDTRAIGTPGYEASVEYVAGQLRDAGFTVETPEFSVVEEITDVETLTVAGDAVDVTAMTYSVSSPVGGVTGPLTVAGAVGCEAADYAGADFSGAVALISRGTCSFAQKQATAAEAGAIAAVIYNNVDGALNGTLGDLDAGVIPTGGIAQADGLALVEQAGADTTLDLQLTRNEVLTRNVIAQTSTGRTDNVVMAGSHLDSVPEGPGINDNGSGTAGLLETALQLGPDPDVENAVRFAWWSAEELGLLGAEDYVAGLDEQGVADIAAYLNFDMIGSDNAAYFVYDGDDSDGEGAGAGPEGSAAIEKSFVDYLGGIGIETEGTDFSGRSDYGPFIAVGIPAGGLFTGAEEIKTEEQAAKWGGEAGVAFDPCYHQACDVIENVNTAALEANSDALANSVAELATSTEAVNGEAPVPPAAEGPADLRAVVTAPLFSDLGAEVPVTVTVTNGSTTASSGATTATAIVTGREVTDAGTGTLLPGGAVRLTVPQLAPGATATFELTASASDTFRIGLAGAFVAPAPGQPDPNLFNNIGIAAAITR